MDTKNWVAAKVPLDYPIMDTDVWGSTYAYKTNKCGTWKNVYFTMVAILVEEELGALR